MLQGNGKKLLLFILLIFTSHIIIAQEENSLDNDKALSNSLDFLKKYFDKGSFWHVTHPETEQTVKGLIQFIEKEPFDSIHVGIKDKLDDEGYRFVYRLPDYVPDSLNVPGYYSAGALRKDLEIAELKYAVNIMNKTWKCRKSV